MRVSSFLRRGSIAALAACTPAFVACSDTAAAPPSGARQDVGILQLIPEAPRFTATAGDTSSGPIKWDLPPGTGVLTAPQVIEVADTVRAGETVKIAVNTVLLSGCMSTDGESVEQSGMLVKITPQDKHSGAQICTLIYGWGKHTVTATFANRGTATIRVAGRRVRQGDDVTSEPVTAERTIVVR